MTEESLRKPPTLVWQGGQIPHPKTQSEVIQPLPTPLGHRLAKLILTVAQACNLRCTYCYAEGGPYGSSNTMMTPEIAIRAVNSILDRYAGVDLFQFFGGEPTLNLPVMKTAVAQVRSRLSASHSLGPTMFGIVTNGTRLSDELIQFYKDTRMRISISHDGPAFIHDAQRPTVSGATSHETIDENLRRLRHERVPFDIQCTYSARHIEAGISVVNLLEYFESLSARAVSIVPAAVPPGSPLDVFTDRLFQKMLASYREAIAFTFRRLREGRQIRFGIFEEAMGILKDNIPAQRHYCDAGTTTLTIAANGEIYPCFMFINNHAFRLGYVAGDHHLGTFVRPPGGVDHGCPGRELLMNKRIAPYGSDEIFKQTIIADVLDGIDHYLQEAEVGLERSK